MGLFDGLLGNATQNNNETAEKELRDVLIPNEKVDMAFTLVRDLIVFTDKRLILVDKQGITGKNRFPTNLFHAFLLKLVDIST